MAHDRTDEVSCGAGMADMTPAVGTPMGGFANRLSACQGALDPLSARALLLQTDQQSLCILTLDALAINTARAHVLAADVSQACAGEVAPEYVRVACSHTHSGVDLSGMFGEAGLIEAYFERVRVAAREAAGQAYRSLMLSIIRRAAVEFPIGRNRRLRPGHARVSDPERAQGERIDHTLTVLSFVKPGTRQALGTLFHIACHPVCLGPENVRASGDFAGIAAQAIEQQTGAPALFLNGACGNVTPLIGRGSTYAATRELGMSLAQAAIAAAQGPGVEAGEGLVVYPSTRAVLPLGCEYQSPDEIDRAADWLLAQDTGFISWDQVVREWQAQMRAQVASGTLPHSIEIPLSAARIGGITFVFAGAELFNEYQLWQPAGVRLVGYADGEGCYVPTAAALEGGGYEVNTSPVFYRLPCAPGSGAEQALLQAIASARGE